MSHSPSAPLADQHMKSSLDAGLSAFRVALRALLFATVIGLGLGTFALPGGVAEGGALASSAQKEPLPTEARAKTTAEQTAGRVVSIRTSLLQLDRLTAASFGDH